MTDLRLAVCDGIIDLVLLDGDLELEQGLETAILAALYSDSRAPEGEEIPDGSTDPRGWWAVDAGDEYGSELWLLERSKLTVETIARAEEVVTRALSWLIEDNIAADLSVVATRDGRAINLAVTITRGDDPDFEAVWAGVEDKIFDFGTSSVRLIFQT